MREHEHGIIHGDAAVYPGASLTYEVRKPHDVSVVVPAFNEEDTLPILHDRLTKVFAHRDETWEWVVVDDGSSDQTVRVMVDLIRENDNVRCLRLSRNFGHEAAIEAGLRAADGRAVILMDADLQDSPDAIAELLTEWHNGADVAYAVRRERKEGRLLRAAFSSYYRLAARTMNIDLPRDAGPFCLLSRRALDAVNAMPEQGRYFPGLRAFVGFETVAVPIERGHRVAGETKYNFRRRVAGAMGAIFSFSRLPLRIATVLGIAVSTVALLLGLWILVSVIVGAHVERGWTSLIVSMFFIGGIQLLVLGITGEYIGRIFDEVRHRPSFIVAEEISHQQITGMRDSWANDERRRAR